VNGYAKTSQNKGLREIVSPFFITKNLISNPTSNLSKIKKPAEAGCIIIVLSPQEAGQGRWRSAALAYPGKWFIDLPLVWKRL
jgi:hypothetical protein